MEHVTGQPVIAAASFTDRRAVRRAAQGGDGVHGVAGRDQGLLLGHPPGQPPVPGAEEGVGTAGADRGFAESSAQVGVAAARGPA